MALILYLMIVILTVNQSIFTKLYNGKYEDIWLFNSVKAICGFAVFAVLCSGKTEFNLPTILYGGAYGVCMSISMYAGYKALKLGPISLTSVLVSFSVLIPVVYGLGFCSEPLTGFRISGILLLIAAIFFMNRQKISAANSTPIHKSWIVFVLVTFMVNGINAIIQKKHQTLFPGMYCKEFMFFGMLLCACITCIGVLIVGVRKWKGKRYGVISGVSNALANFGTLLLAGAENASVLYPVISAGTSILTLGCGMVMFKERPKAEQWIALVLGIAAVILLKL